MVDVSGLKYYFRRYKYLQRRRTELASIDKDNSNDHVYLIAYPKSGNTWMRVLLANMLNDKPDLDIAFHNVGDFIPDSHIPEQRKYVTNPDSHFNSLPIHLIKSHDGYKGFYRGKKVIYLVRNGAKVIPSFFHYINARKAVKVSYEDILNGRASHSFGSWFKHVSSWLDRKTENILVVEYEKLRKNTETELQRIGEFLGLNLNKEKLQLAIKKSDFGNMKELESKYGYFNDTRTEKGKKTPFVREGGTTSDKGELPDIIFKKISFQQSIITNKLNKL
jgi:hypothetical protein